MQICFFKEAKVTRQEKAGKLQREQLIAGETEPRVPSIVPTDHILSNAGQMHPFTSHWSKFPIGDISNHRLRTSSAVPSESATVWCLPSVAIMYPCPKREPTAAKPFLSFQVIPRK